LDLYCYSPIRLHDADRDNFTFSFHIIPADHNANLHDLEILDAICSIEYFYIICGVEKDKKEKQKDVNVEGRN